MLMAVQALWLQPCAAQEDTATTPAANAQSGGTADTTPAVKKPRKHPPLRAAFSSNYKLLAPSPIIHGKGDSIGFHSSNTRGGAPLFFLPKYFGTLALNYRYAHPLIYGNSHRELDRSLHTLGLTANFGFRFSPELMLMVFGGAAMSGDYEEIDLHSFIPRLGTIVSWKYSDEWKFMFGLNMSGAYLYYIPIPFVGFSYARKGSPIGAALGPPGGINMTLRFVEQHVLRFGVNFSGGNWQIHPGPDAPAGVTRLRMIEVQAGIHSYQNIAGPVWLGLELGYSLFSVLRTTDNYRTEYDWIRRKPAPYMGVSLLIVPPPRKKAQ